MFRSQSLPFLGLRVVFVNPVPFVPVVGYGELVFSVALSSGLLGVTGGSVVG